MSEVKLYVHTSTIVFDKFFQQEMESVGLRPATTAEIMASHPKCGECRHYHGIDVGHPYRIESHWCRNNKSPYNPKDGEINPDTDYCRHWEAKT